MSDEPIDMGFMSFPPELQEELARHMVQRPKLPRSKDGIYPRCVWCNGENYMPHVLAYSAGETSCASTTNCGKYLPPDYIRYTREKS